MNTNRSAESGSVLYWIFIAVALFAALSFAVSNISRSGQQGGMNELAKTRATEILQYAGAVQRGIRIMRINGIDETALCFHAVQWGNADYQFNPQCTVNSNLVFHPEGGGISFEDGISEWYDPTISITEGGQWLFSARYEVEKVGTDGGTVNSENANVDLLMVTAPIGDILCEAINDLLGYSPATPPGVPAATYTNLQANKFSGSYTGQNGSKIGDLGRERCVNVPAATPFKMYYKVILAR